MKLKQYIIFLGLLTIIMTVRSTPFNIILTNNHSVPEVKEYKQIFAPNSAAITFTDNNFDFGSDNAYNYPRQSIALMDANWISFFTGSVIGQQSWILPKSRDSMGFCIDSVFYGMYNITHSYNNNIVYNHLHMPNAGYMTINGSPAVPIVKRYFEVPYGVNLSLSILYTDNQILSSDFYVVPAFEPYDEYPGAPEPTPAINDTVYNTDSYFPAECASIDSEWATTPLVIRGHRILPVTFYPVQFNPVQEKLRVYSKIEVRIEYDYPAYVDEVPSRLESPAFTALCEGLIANYRYRPGFHADPYIPLWEPEQEDLGAEYLIITHADFYDAVQPLAEWKERKGVRTKVVKTADIGPAGITADDIFNYIQTAYNTWNPAPSFLLLVGDSEYIPTHYHTTHKSSSHGGAKTPSDLYYATVDGTDYFPDIYVGRISVDSNQDAMIVVQKILNYEKNPPVTGAFYNHVTASAQFQDDNDNGYEDRRFVLTSETIRNHLLWEGYDVNRVYYADPAVTPTRYNNGQYNAGQKIPDELLRSNGFAWDGSAADINTNITNGCFFLYHRDHGISDNFYHHGDGWFGGGDGWGAPAYSTGNVGTLTNGDLLPFIFSIECQSGWFDGEIDQLNDPALTHSSESICETFVRHAGGGAIAAIGATRNSQSGYNDYLMYGFLAAICPEFIPVYATRGLYSFGQILLFGKMKIADSWSYRDPYIRQAFEMYHLFGDPETQLWTKRPTGLNVNHPSIIGSEGSQEFIVSVTDGSGDPVQFAKVCLDKDTDIYEVVYTNSDGHAYFNIEPSAGEMNITVTKHNCRPYLDTIIVTAGGASLSLNPLHGPEGTNVRISGNFFSGSETVDIYFGTTTPATSTTASGGSFVIDPFTVPTGSDGSFNVITIGQTSGRAAVTVFRRLPYTDLPNPHMYCQWDPSTWYLNPAGEDPVWDNPCIELFDRRSSVSSDDLVIGKTYTIKATIYNDEPMVAKDTEVTFRWAFWGSGQRTWNLIGTDTITVSLTGSAIAEVDWTPTITGHVCILATIYHPWDKDLYIDPNFNCGQENTHVARLSSPANVSIIVNNPTIKTALIYLEAKQIEGGTDIWPARIMRDFPQIQRPNENKTVILTVDAPEYIQEGETRTFVVNAYIGSLLIGGVEIVFEKGSPTTPSTALDPTPILVVTLVASSVLLLLVISRLIMRRIRK
ncbi:MAG: C25 family cysteine peptidase [Candidatus Hermodarchaeota archaeon]